MALEQSAKITSSVVERRQKNIRQGRERVLLDITNQEHLQKKLFDAKQAADSDFRHLYREKAHMYHALLEQAKRKDQVLDEACNLCLQTIRCLNTVLKVHLDVQVENHF